MEGRPSHHRSMRPFRSIVLLAPWLLGCRGAPDPLETGATLLPGTEGASYMTGDPFSISPSSGWILFARDEERVADADVATMSLGWLRSYVLYDREARRAVPLEADAERISAYFEQWGSLLQDAGCWPTEAEVVLRSAFGSYLELHADRTPREWRVSERERFSLSSACPPRPEPEERFRRWGAFVVEHTSRDGIRIRQADDPSKVFAEHRGRWPWQSVVLGDVALSPDGRALAYVVSRALGSWVGAPVAYVVSADAGRGSPRALGGPTLALRWSPDQSGLVAYARRRGTEDYALVEWPRDALR